jgi:hypothetical protein
MSSQKPEVEEFHTIEVNGKPGKRIFVSLDRIVRQIVLTMVHLVCLQRPLVLILRMPSQPRSTRGTVGFQSRFGSSFVALPTFISC